MKRVVVGLSGGVDSSVAAYLLKEQGYEVIGLFMKNWHDDSVTISDECPWLEDSNDALIVAEKLGIPFQTIDLSEQYKERIVDYMFNEYEKGRTPNPDVLCNREIKFDIFLKAAMDLGADYVATGHYCRKDEFEKDGEMVYRLLAGKDNNKDQSYFLCQLNQEQLSKALFPIGHLEKPEVRKIAAEADLITAEKKDSQGLCFIGKVRLPDFLQQKLKPKDGKIVEITEDAPVFKAHQEKIQQAASEEEWLKAISAPYQFHPTMGKEVGDHRGAHYFTIGQRKGLSVGGTKEPLFVVDTNTDSNVIFTGQGKNHPGLKRYGLFVSNQESHWVREDLRLKVGEMKKYLARIRYREELSAATLYQKEDGLYIVFDQERVGVAAGQFVAWYDGEELIGSGTIG
ncbi:tRNA 2-thiouridine(34) synthase MnmA [Persicobacter diffluens]|uniref:tRNA-specific 2-thiouridylase MnmA n=1 Tax=Persicobacter diffluens TaxID=981 RepID=A0AAN4VWE9_9BACT|nr:tRNA-specific 2-thiouridylase MnmA [Persicobacter diffluens]